MISHFLNYAMNIGRECSEFSEYSKYGLVNIINLVENVFRME